MRGTGFVALILSAVLLAGCAPLSRAARVDPGGVAFRSAPSGKPCDLVAPMTGDDALAINLDCYRFHSDDRYTAYELASGKSYDPASTRLPFTNQSMMEARNRLGFALLGHADLLCEREKGFVYSNRAASNAFLDFLGSGFAIGSTIVGGEQAKSILSGLAGLSVATRTNVDANVYQNQLVSAITKMMDADRIATLERIRAKVNQPVAQFSADEMIMMVNQYHQSCSFQKGVQLLLDAAVNKEGVDHIIRSINLRNAIAESTRLQAAEGIDEDSPENAAITAARAEAILELFEIAKTSNAVVVAPAAAVQPPAVTQDADGEAP